MRLCYRFLIVCSLLIVISCVEYDQFERIENDKPRVVAIRYEPTADIAPGDTLTGKIYFAGNEVVSVDDFSIAYVHNFDKNHTFPDEKKIELVSTRTWFPDSMQFKYRIPEDVFIKENIQGNTDSIKTKTIVGMINNNSKSGDSLLNLIPKDSLQSILTVISALYARPTIFFHVHSKNGYDLKISTEFIVRYNSRFPQHLPVNNNPQIKWIAVYKVPENLSNNFSPKNPDLAGKFTVTYLYNEYPQKAISDTIDIDKGYRYFLDGDNGINTYVTSSGDTVHDITCDFVQVHIYDTVYTLPEIYTYNWFFQNEDDLDEVKDSLLTIIDGNSGSYLKELNPPVFTNMQHFRLWLVIYDESPDELNRPRGFAMRSVRGVFKYSDAYKKSVK